MKPSFTPLNSNIRKTPIYDPNNEIHAKSIMRIHACKRKESSRLKLTQIRNGLRFLPTEAKKEVIEDDFLPKSAMEGYRR